MEIPAENDLPAFPTRMDLFNLLRTEDLLRHGATQEVIFRLKNYLEQQSDKLREDSDPFLYKDIKIFLCNLLRRWKSCKSKEKSFLTKHNQWLQSSFDLTKYTEEQSQQPGPSTSDSTPTRNLTLGRPPKSFLETQSRAKRRKIDNLLCKAPEELAHATQTAYISQGKRDVAAVIKNVTEKSPRSVKVIKRACEKKRLKQVSTPRYTYSEALAVMVNCQLTKAQYISLRKSAMSKGIKLYPPYFRVIEAKEKCYPEKIEITETTVNIELQDLLDFTTKRLAKVQKDVISQVLQESIDHGVFKLVSKWGTDGSSGHSLYSQKFTNPSNTDSDILQTSLVPIQLLYDTPNKSVIIWKNPRPSSTRFCRPIRFSFCKETEEKLLEEIRLIDNQIEQLQPTSVIIDTETNILVTHILHKTMLDGKVCNVLTYTKSAQVCYICGASPKNMNNLKEILDRPCKRDHFSFGLSTLHARIRFMECLLHISYRLMVKQWRVPKGSVDERKKTIIDKFKSEMGLLIDIVKQGKGTTNDGNTSRRFFANPEKVAEITEIDENLIKRFAVILDTICSGYDINIDAFKAYALETAKQYVALYKWYPMPASVHKILIHSADVMETILCPIGNLSEEALEARHKEYRLFRKHNTRKISRISTNQDLVHYLLFSSDPLINSLRPLPKKPKGALSKDVLSLLVAKEL